MKKGIKFYKTLFVSTFTLSTFTVGGGYVIVPLMRKKFVKDLKWIGEEEMLNIVAISQSAPGSIAVNAAIMLGYSLSGVRGALVAAIGTVLPPLITISLIAKFYMVFKENNIVKALFLGMRAGVAAVIIDVIIRMATALIKTKNKLSIGIMITAFIASVFFDISAPLIIVASGALGGFYYNIIQKGGDQV